MNLNTDILYQLNSIYHDSEEAYKLLGVFENFKLGRKILLVNAYEDQAFKLNDYDVVINLAENVSLELIDRIVKTVQSYIREQEGKLRQVQVNNLPWVED